MKTTTPRCFVVGAGIGGLTTAALLSQGRRCVDLYEKNDFFGGKVSRITGDQGLVYDRGPSIIVLKNVYEHLFQMLQRPLSSYLDFIPLEPGFTVRGSDGSSFTIHSNLGETLKSVSALDPRSARELEVFLKRCGELAARLGLGYASRPYTKLWHLFYPDLMRSALVVSPFKSYGAFIRESFRHPLLRQFFCGFPSYSGLHPDKAPASLALLPWSLLCEGVFYPRGGVVSIAKALYDICVENGVTFHFNRQLVAAQQTETRMGARAVSQLVFCDPRSSQNTENVNVARKDPIVFNGDVSLLTNILPGGFPADWQLQSPSFFTMMFGLPQEFVNRNGLGHHNLFLPTDHPTCYRDFYEPGSPYPQRPPLYLNIPSVTDKRVAPEHLCNCFLVVSVPSFLNTDAAQESLKNYPHELWQELRRYVTFSDENPLAPLIQDPLFFAKTYLQKGGQIYGPDPNKTGVLMKLFRVPQKIRSNFFAVGGSVQPGAGLPMVVQSAKIVTGMIEHGFFQ